MPSLNFGGASNFSISGGNFNDVAGNVVTYNFSNGVEGLPPDTLANLASNNAVNNTGNRLSRRERKRLAQQGQAMSPLPGAHIQPVPSSVVSSSPSVAPMNMAMSPTSHYSHSQRSTLPIPPTSPLSAFTPSPISESSLDLGSEGYGATSPHSSRHSTPPTDLEEHENIGSSGIPPSNHESGVDLLTPLTNSLGLQRFTPATAPQTLPTVYEDTTPVQAPTQNLSPVSESSAEFGLAPRRSPLGPPPPPPASTRPVSRMLAARPQGEEAQREHQNSLGPPPPVPPRPVALSPAWTSTTVPVDTPFPVSRPMPVSPSTPVQVSSPTGRLELEDPAARIARLQAQRSSTKGYASDLSPRSQNATPRYSPVNVGAASTPPPPPPPTRPPSLPASSVIVPSPIPNDNHALAPVPEVDAPRVAHWTSDSITGWAGDVNGHRLGDSDTLSSGNSRSVLPPTTPPHRQMHLYDEQQYHHQPLPMQQYHDLRQAPPWGGVQLHPSQIPFGFNPAPNPSFPPFPFNNAAPFAVPPFGVPHFGGPAFGGGYPFQG